MTSVVTQSRSQVNVNVWSSSTTMATAHILATLHKIAEGRGLDVMPIQENFKLTERGLQVWLALRQLKSCRLEAYEGSKILERWDIGVVFNTSPLAPGTQLPCQVSHDALERALAGMEKLPPGTNYRVVAMLPPDAALVPGWNEAERYDDSKLVHHDLGANGDFHHILTKLGLWKR